MWAHSYWRQAYTYWMMWCRQLFNHRRCRLRVDGVSQSLRVRGPSTPTILTTSKLIQTLQAAVYRGININRVYSQCPRLYGCLVRVASGCPLYMYLTHGAGSALRQNAMILFCQWYFGEHCRPIRQGAPKLYPSELCCIQNNQCMEYFAGYTKLMFQIPGQLLALA